MLLAETPIDDIGSLPPQNVKQPKRFEISHGDHPIRGVVGSLCSVHRQVCHLMSKSGKIGGYDVTLDLASAEEVTWVLVDNCNFHPESYLTGQHRGRFKPFSVDIDCLQSSDRAELDTIGQRQTKQAECMSQIPGQRQIQEV